PPSESQAARLRRGYGEDAGNCRSGGVCAEFIKSINGEGHGAALGSNAFTAYLARTVRGASRQFFLASTAARAMANHRVELPGRERQRREARRVKLAGASESNALQLQMAPAFFSAL